jgi:hypothetical protein
MANTYALIASYSATGSVADITFTSIPATYTDLLVHLSARTNAVGAMDNIKLDFNGTSSNRSFRGVYGTGSAAGSETDTTIMAGYVSGDGATASTFGSTFIYIPNYTSSNYKSVSTDSVGENNATYALANLNAALWSDTAAITSIKLYPNASGNFKQYSTAYLYGISNS